MSYFDTLDIDDKVIAVMTNRGAFSFDQLLALTGIECMRLRVSLSNLTKRGIVDEVDVYTVDEFGESDELGWALA